MRHYILLLLSLFLVQACQRADITPSGFADDRFYLKVKGFNMPVHVAGNLDSRKMIIILHGGPGGNAAVYRDNTVKTRVEPHIAVVYFDQRGAGGTQGNGKMTELEDYREDIHKLVALLRDKYGQDQKIYLMGHSWGGFLAPFYLLEHQNTVQGWIQVDGAHRGNMNSLIKNMLLEYGSNPMYNSVDTGFWASAIRYCNSADYSDNSHGSSLELNLMAQKAEEKISTVIDSINAPDKIKYIPGMANRVNYFSSFAIYQIHPKYFEYDPVTPRLADIKTPVLLLWGKFDFVCPPALTDELMAGLGSIDKTRIIYDGAGHSPMINRPVSFWDDLVNWVKTH